jgi:hypothetical protein
MNSKLTLLGAGTLLLASLSGNLARADSLPNNFWPNASFENGVNLNAVDGSGTPAGWNRGGSDATICQVTSSNSISSTHSLMVNDGDVSNYGEWYSDVSLTGVASPGDTINIQFYELFSIADGEMRVSVLFFDSGNNVVAQNHFVVTGDSPGWGGTIEASTFTKQLQSVIVPIGAVDVRVSVVSGGSSVTSGVLVVDDLSLARASTPVLQAGNIWPNPSFEIGSSLDSPAGTPTGWNRGGSAPSMCQVATNNYVSTGHALMQNDADASNYAEWYSDLLLSGVASPGAALNLQWFELYNISNGEMRLSILFFDAGDNVIQQNHFTATGPSAGWQGTIGGSAFTKRNQALVVPPGAVKMRASFVSGGPSATVGVMLIDDLTIAPPPAPPLLTGNFWPNPNFELGVSLDQTNGTPSGWNKGGSAASIDQVTTAGSASPTHALAIIDSDINNYGEWYADLTLGTNASPGNLLDIQYSVMYNVTNGPMRVSVLFFDAGNNGVGNTDFNVTGQSAGWQGAIAGSTFTTQMQQVTVPPLATRMRMSVVSGGPSTATGLLLVDDLFVAVHVVPITLLTDNFFPNPTFENGAQLDNATLGIPAGGWQRGGSASAIDQVSTNKSVTATHSLALVDNDAGNYGEWYMFFNLSGLVTNNDAVDIQWFQLYSTTNGAMRLSFAFLDADNNTLFGVDYNVSGQSPDWLGSVDASPFQQQSQRLLVPVGTTKLRVNLASGGSAAVVGTMLVDDLSVRLSKPFITAATRESGAFTLVWNSMPSKNYTVSFTSTLSGTPVWTPLAIHIPGATGLLTTPYLDTVTHGGSNGYYRVVQE